MSTDPFVTVPIDQAGPCTHAAIVSPNNDADLSVIPRCLLIGTAGALKVDTRGGETGITLQVQAGILPLRVTRIYATGTTAADIVALW